MLFQLFRSHIDGLGNIFKFFVGNFTLAHFNAVVNGKGHIGTFGNFNQRQVLFVADLTQTGTQSFQTAFFVDFVSSLLFAPPGLDNFLLGILFINK